MKSVDLYTDGACSGNPGPGGWGCILIFNEVEKEMSGFDKDTTNNRMEITAVLKGLEALKQACNVTVYTDSSYVFNAYDKGWIKNWIKNGWKTSTKKPVSNKDLWLQMLELTNLHKVRFVKVKGHSDNEYNNRCDRLATGEIKKFRSQ